jgi:D-lactate dehydrogenase
MPTGIAAPHFPQAHPNLPRTAVYFPSCINRVMGPAHGDPDRTPLHQVVRRVLSRAGFSVIVPPNPGAFCCGTPFESKGYMRQADDKAAELNDALLRASENGRYPVLCDTAPCVHRMRQSLDPRLAIYEPVEFIQNFLLDHLTIAPVNATVAIHVTCSSRKMGLEAAFRNVARQLAAEAIFPEEVSCCGWAGDRGFNFPELPASALVGLRPALQDRCAAGYSNSRTCEIGLSQHSGIYYKSIFYLLDHCSREK